MTVYCCSLLVGALDRCHSCMPQTKCSDCDRTRLSSVGYGYTLKAIYSLSHKKFYYQTWQYPGASIYGPKVVQLLSNCEEIRRLIPYRGVWGFARSSAPWSFGEWRRGFVSDKSSKVTTTYTEYIILITKIHHIDYRFTSFFSHNIWYIR